VPCLVYSGSSSTLSLRGGTDVGMAPSIGYFEHVLAPVIGRYLGVTIGVQVHRRGYFPKGGGEVEVMVTPPDRAAFPLPNFCIERHFTAAAAIPPKNTPATTTKAPRSSPTFPTNLPQKSHIHPGSPSKPPVPAAAAAIAAVINTGVESELEHPNRPPFSTPNYPNQAVVPPPFSPNHASHPSQAQVLPPNYPNHPDKTLMTPPPPSPMRLNVFVVDTSGQNP